jgi:hypothetical protein
MTVKDPTWLLANRDSFNRELSVLGLTREKVETTVFSIFYRQQLMGVEPRTSYGSIVLEPTDMRHGKRC